MLSVTVTRHMRMHTHTTGIDTEQKAAGVGKNVEALDPRDPATRFWPRTPEKRQHVYTARHTRTR